MASTLKPLTDEEMFGASPALKPLTDEEMFGDTQREPSLLGRASQYVSSPTVGLKTVPQIVTGLTRFANPFPTSPTANPVAMLEGKRKFLESAGQQVKESEQGSIGNIVSKTSELARKYLPKELADTVQTISGLGGGAAATVAQFQPFTPSEFALQSGMSILPVALSQGTKGIQSQIANRNLQAPKLIRESRYSSGKPSVGEVALNTPEKTADLATSNKDKIYKESNRAINVLGEKIKNTIANVFKSGESSASRNMNPFSQAQDLPSLNTKEVADSVNPILNSIGRSQGADSPTFKAVMELKNRFVRMNGDAMNFLDANRARIDLGEEIGKSFNKDTSAIPEIVEAQRAIWASLRNKIGQLSPDLDEMLKLQHDLLDVRTSALPEASLGYTKTPSTVIDLIKKPFRSIKVAKFLGKTLPDQGSKAGAVVGLASSQDIPVKFKRKN